MRAMDCSVLFSPNRSLSPQGAGRWGCFEVFLNGKPKRPLHFLGIFGVSPYLTCSEREREREGEGEGEGECWISLLPPVDKMQYLTCLQTNAILYSQYYSIVPRSFSG